MRKILIAAVAASTLGAIAPSAMAQPYWGYRPYWRPGPYYRPYFRPYAYGPYVRPYGYWRPYRCYYRYRCW